VKVSLIVADECEGSAAVISEFAHARVEAAAAVKL
jgi:hypothetical protein